MVDTIKDPEGGERRDTRGKIKLIMRVGQMVCELVAKAETRCKFKW